MARAARSAGFWRSIRNLPERTPLRVKLITAVLALVLLALAVISFAGIAYIKDYLINRADSQLQVLAANNAGNGYAPRGAVSLGPQIGERSLIEVIAPSGQAFPSRSSQLSPTDPKIPASAAWQASHAGRPVTVPAEHGGDSWRVIVQPGQPSELTTGQTFTGTVVTGLDVTDVYATIARLEGFDILLSVGIVLILALVATAAVRASLRPLNDIEETAGAIAAGDLSKRVPERDPRTEMGRLGRSLNAMLSQIESAFQSRSRSEAAARRSEERMRQFVADASHELRTPLTAIRGFAEYYRQRGGVAVDATGPDATTPTSQATPTGETGLPGEATPSGRTTPTSEVAPTSDGRRGAAPHPLAPADLDRIMRRVEQESARMGILVEDMLLLARLDQQRPLTASPVDLLTLAADAVHDARVVAPGRSVNLTVSSGRALLVIGDEVRLRQVIGNLMSNALTHTPDGTPIDVLIRSGNLDEAPAATAIAGPGVTEPSLKREPAAGNQLASNSRPASPAPDNGDVTDGSPATDNEQVADSSPARDSSPTADNGDVTDGSPATDNEQVADGSPATDNEQVADSSPTADNAHVTDGSPATDNEQVADSSPARDSSAAADSGHFAANWATPGGEMRFDADHVPPPPGDPAPGLPAGRVPAERVPASEPAAVLEVTDHGPGLTREQAEHVFERFYRADPARTTGGTGLGLAIVAALVAAHGGAAWVRSRPGEGATFCIALPLSPEAMHSADSDFDGEADAVTADDITGDAGTVENGPGLNGSSRDDAGETRFDGTRAAEPGTAYTAATRAELGG